MIIMGHRLPCSHPLATCLWKPLVSHGCLGTHQGLLQAHITRLYGRKSIKLSSMQSHKPQPNEEQAAEPSPSDTTGRRHLAKTRTSVANNSLDNVTVFHRPTRHSFNVPLNCPDKQVSLVLNQSNVINLDFNDTFWNEVKRTQISLQEEKAPNEEDANVKSIDELVWKPLNVDRKQLVSYYMKLSKIRLTGLVVLTAMAGYGIAPGTFHPGTFALCTLGTALTSSSANTINQFFEVPYDSQMNRTKNRVLVRGLLSPLHAVGFAAVAGVMGVTVLALGVNPLTAALGAFNLGLYTLIYTPMKRLHMANTWVGSIVGAVPPMMGWAASTGTLDAGAFLLGAILYAWQFPHFNALSWNLRPDYSRAGYQMCSVVNPALCKRVAFRYSAGMIVLCTLAPILDVTTWIFAADSLPLNLLLTYLGWRFYKDGDSKSSRNLFKFSLIHIPALLILMLISKKNYGEREVVKSGVVVEKAAAAS